MTGKPTIWQVLFFKQSLGKVVWLILRFLFVSQNPSEICESHSPGRIPGWEYTTCVYDQIPTSCPIHSRSPCPPGHFSPSTLSTRLRHSLLIGFIFSFQSVLNLHLLFYCVFSIFALTSSSSSSSCRAGSTDIPDPLSPLFPIVHRLRQVFWTTSRILT